MKTIGNILILTFSLLFCVSTPMISRDKKEKPHYISIKNAKQLHAYFKYSPTRPILISGHRGGMLKGYPENCIESFEKTLSYMESFFEIDPRLTKDSIIVLMHDATIDRTTTGKGKVSDYTYQELLQFNLVDREGNATPYKIPTLEECIKWSKGKTILNLDIKDVPLQFMADFIDKIKPVNVMYTVHNAKQARYYYDRNNQAMFSCWCKNMDEFNNYENAGLPWKQIMAYVGPSIKPDQQTLYNALHKNGVMCMISVAPTHDRTKTDIEKINGYKAEIAKHPDVIETDYPYLFKDIDKAK
nr:glycerophosphodiester phosphodiesterase family protein [Parabacteroides pacaensis]